MREALCYKRKGQLFFQQKKIPRKSKVLRRLGVKKNTFAGNMMARVYDYYFQGSVNFRKEYRKYYRKEFSSIEIFIEERFNIKHDEAVKIAAGNYSMKECSCRSIERNIETLNYDEAFRQAFSEAIGGLDDEDPDGIYYE